MPDHFKVGFTVGFVDCIVWNLINVFNKKAGKGALAVND
jgi:hypothetical protein